MTEVVKSEILNSGPFKQVFEASLHALPFACRARFRRKNPLFTHNGGTPPQLTGEFGRHRDVPHFSALEFRSHRQQPLAVHNVRPPKAKDL